MPRPAPSRPRLALILTLGAYPVITGLLYLWSPLLAGAPPWATAALIVPQMVSAMIWVVIPLANRWFGWFIAPRRTAEA